MYSVTGLEFSFTQAPESMRSVLQGCWMVSLLHPQFLKSENLFIYLQLTIAFGNLIVVIIAGAKFFDSQKWEFFLFSGLMFVDMIIFMWLASRYRPIPLEELDRIDEDLLQNEEKRSPLEFQANDNEGFDKKE